MRNAFAASSSGKRWVISFSTGICVVDDEPGDVRPFPDREVPGADHRQELANELIARVDLGLARLADEGHPAELCRAVQGGVLSGGAARTVDGDVDAAAPGELAQSFSWILLAAVDRRVGAEPPCLLQPALQNVDGNHSRATPLGDEDAGPTHRADPEHGDGIGTRDTQAGAVRRTACRPCRSSPHQPRS